jgi:hypothetical protein
MKLARIEHWKCGEPMSWRGGGSYTYVWVPEEMTAEELDTLCEKAQQEYLETERVFKSLAPVSPPGYGVTIHPNTPDTMTVGELRAKYAADAKAYKEHQEAVSKSRKPFAWYLGYKYNALSTGVLQFWQHKPDLEVKVDWGHNHGVTIEHSPTVLGDYPFPADEGEL